MYDEKVEMLKVFSCGVTAFVYKALGGSARIFIILCTLMLVDTIFGWIKVYIIKIEALKQQGVAF